MRTLPLRGYDLAPMPPTLPGERLLRAQMVEAGRRLHARSLISGGEGNLTARLGKELLLCTPTATNKGFLEPRDLVVTDLRGASRGKGRPSSELLLHLACYQERPDCLAVVHAHPAHAIALTLSGDALLPCMPETVTGLGPVPTAPYATPGVPDVAEAVRPFLKDADCVLMERHGALCMGLGANALLDACDRMEMLEGVARVQWLASLRRAPTPLPASEIKILQAQRAAMRAKPRR